MPRFLSACVAVFVAIAGFVATADAQARTVPHVSAVSPSHGTIAGGGVVTVTGSGFTQVQHVRFGTTNATGVHVVSSSKLTAHAPAHAGGTVDVRVVTGGGTTPIVTADRYRYALTPASYATTAAMPQHGHPSALSCPSTTFCMIGDQNGAVVRFENGTAEPPNRIMNAIQDLSCASTTYCLAVGPDNLEYKYTGTWMKIDSSPLSGAPLHVSCAPATTFCMVVDNKGNVADYDGSSWSASASVTSGFPTTLSCATTSFCVLGDHDGNIARYTSGTWTAATPVTNHGGVASVSCVTSTFCIGDDDSGFDLRWNGTSWQSLAQPMTTGFVVSCTSTTFCSALGYDFANSAILGSAFNGSSWSSLEGYQSDDPPAAFTCVLATTQCGLVSLGGFLAPPSGQPQEADPAPAGAFVQCPGTTCIAVDNVGEVARQSNGGAWQPLARVVDTFPTVSALSCPAATWCMAAGQSLWRFNGTTWLDTHPNDVSQFSAVSCPSPSFCAAIDSHSHALFWDGTRWSGPGTIDGDTGISALSCASSTLCVALDGAGRALVFNGRSWTAPEWIDGTSQPLSISCTGTQCLAGDSDGRVIAYRAGTWSAPMQLGAGSVTGISCLATGLCYAATPTAVVAVLGTWHQGVPVGQPGYPSISCTATPVCTTIDQNLAAHRGS